MVSESGHPREGFVPPSSVCDGTEGRGECWGGLIFLFPELLEWLDKEMFFLWQRQMGRARPSGTELLLLH